MGTRERRIRIGGMALVAASLLAACGEGSDRAAVAPDPTGRGWIDGEPTWSGGESGAAVGALDRAEAGGVADGTVEPASPSKPAGTAGGYGGEPTPDTSPLRAGSVDDNADLPAFLTYLARLRTEGIELRDLDPTGRAVVTVVGNDGRPIPGVEVIASQDGKELARLRTTANGTVRLLPAFIGGSATEPTTVEIDGQQVDVKPGVDVQIELDRTGGVEGDVPIDILFLLDATGSMGDEIDRLKTSVDSVAERIEKLGGSPDIRLAMTIYRDEGDAFVTSTYDFTGDVAAFRKALSEVQADGGGDLPEALEEGLGEALAKPTWRDPASAVQLVFLVADAPPHLDRSPAVTYPAAVRDAVARGIKIFPVASSSSDDQAEGVFRQIAQATGARFVFLSYGAEGAATGSKTDIDTTDYEELSLDDLVVRLVSEELDALQRTDDPTDPNGTTTTSSTTTVPETTTTTNPPGQ
jgi:Mg-chelatase subunit ChlD